MANYKESLISGAGGENILLRTWDSVSNPAGSIQILHGMAEHGARYDDFASYLNEKGYIVYAGDHRGHGKYAAENNALGCIGNDGFNNIVEDNKIISDLIKEKYKGIPLYIFAHSFGSFVGQEYILRYSEDIDGIVLSGSAKQNGIDVKAGYVLAKLQNKFAHESKAVLIDKLSFGSYNSKIKNNKTKFDWLSRDAAEVDKYINDELCGYISSVNFYYNFFKGLKKLYSPDRLMHIQKSLPVLIVSGDSDPVGKYGKSTKKLFEQYADIGVQNLTLKLFEGSRHEILNDINKSEVYEYIYQWLKSLT